MKEVQLMSLFGKKPYPREAKQEAERLINELMRIGTTDDYLSERPGHPFNSKCRHMRTREIGKRLEALI